MSDLPRQPPAAGWYPDPQDAHYIRYWDGTRWSDHPDGRKLAPPVRPPPPAAPKRRVRGLLIAAAAIVGLLTIAAIAGQEPTTAKELATTACPQLRAAGDAASARARALDLAKEAVEAGITAQSLNRELQRRCPKAADAAFSEPEVVYRLSGTASTASVTLQNGSGGTEQGDVKIPFEHKVRAPSGEFLYLSAQIDEYGGSLTCEIYVDGRLVQTATSTGEHRIATCDASVP